MKKVVFFLILILLPVLSLHGQGSSIVGFVSRYRPVESSSTIAHEGAKVVLQTDSGLLEYEVTSDGFFQFEDLEPSFVDLTVSKEGVWPFSETFEILDGINFCFLFVTELSRVGEEHKPIRLGQSAVLNNTSSRYTPIELGSCEDGRIEVLSGIFAPLDELIVHYGDPRNGERSTAEMNPIDNKALDMLCALDGVELDGNTLRLDPSRFHVTAYEKGVLISRLKQE